VKDFADYAVGDRVYSLAWIGKPFSIVAKNEERGILSLQGSLENDPQGAQVDVFKSTIWMVTDEPWDQLWYWPDRCGERYLEVFKRFVGAHNAGEIVTGHFVEGANPLQGLACTPDRAMAFRIVMMTDSMVMVEPVVGLKANGEPVREARQDEEIRWISTGPAVAARLRMVGYRWAVTFGDIVLNGADFAGLT
jgi:hypothetical protein